MRSTDFIRWEVQDQLINTLNTSRCIPPPFPPFPKKKRKKNLPLFSSFFCLWLFMVSYLSLSFCIPGGYSCLFLQQRLLKSTIICMLGFIISFFLFIASEMNTIFIILILDKSYKNVVAANNLAYKSKTEKLS